MRNISDKSHRINHGKPLVMASENYLAKHYWARFVNSTWPYFCGGLLHWPVTSVALGFSVERPVSTLDQSSYPPHYRTKGFPASTNFEPKLAVMALKWSAKNGTPKSPLISVHTMLPGRTGSEETWIVTPAAPRSGCLQRTSIWGTRSQSWDR